MNRPAPSSPILRVAAVGTLALILSLILLFTAFTNLFDAVCDAARAVPGRGPSMRQLRRAALKLAATDPNAGEEDAELELVLICIPPLWVGAGMRLVAASRLVIAAGEASIFSKLAVG